jgi:hypothetical protein
MSEWALVFVTVWFLGTSVGTVLGILLVRGGSMRPTPCPNCSDPTGREQAA